MDTYSVSNLDALPQFVLYFSLFLATAGDSNHEGYYPNLTYSNHKKNKMKKYPPHLEKIWEYFPYL